LRVREDVRSLAKIRKLITKEKKMNISKEQLKELFIAEKRLSALENTGYVLYLDEKGENEFPETVENEFQKLLASQNKITEEKLNVDDAEIRRLVSTKTRLEMLGFGKWDTEDCRKREKAFIEMFYGNEDTIESIAERHARRAFLISGK
jgi:hypothetical protein